MKVILINGSPHSHGSTFAALEQMISVFDKNGIETELIQVGHLNIPGCKGCGYCHKNGHCVQSDLVDEINAKIKEVDGLVVGSPVYYASPNGTLISFLDRLFYSKNADYSMKVGASVVSARRSGTVASFDVLNRYFTINNMPVAPSQYWNNIHGNNYDEAQQDAEGLQTMRTLAQNMIFMMEAIQNEKKNGLPEREKKTPTNFIR